MVTESQSLCEYKIPMGHDTHEPTNPTFIQICHAEVESKSYQMIQSKKLLKENVMEER